MEVYWLSDAAGGVPLDNAWLSEGEFAVLERLRIPKRRADWRLGRWTAKRAIAMHLRLADDARGLAAIEIRSAPSGAPEAYAGGRTAGLSLSLSHSHGVAFCALSSAGASLGCDVEQVTPHSEAFLADYFTAKEQDLVAQCPVVYREILLTLLWSAKESALKALECGLRSDTRSVEVAPVGPPPSNDEEWRPLTAAHIDGRIFRGWWRQTGALVWTVVAIPQPQLPVALSQASRASIVP